MFTTPLPKERGDFFGFGVNKQHPKMQRIPLQNPKMKSPKYHRFLSFNYSG
jgi:hypothetical protein